MGKKTKMRCWVFKKKKNLTRTQFIPMKASLRPHHPWADILNLNSSQICVNLLKPSCWLTIFRFELTSTVKWLNPIIRCTKFQLTKNATPQTTTHTPGCWLLWLLAILNIMVTIRWDIQYIVLSQKCTSGAFSFRTVFQCCNYEPILELHTHHSRTNIAIVICIYM